MEAARHWAGGPENEEEIGDDLAAFGAGADVIETWNARDKPFELLTENWPAVRLFLMCGTQWRHAGMEGTPTGLDYAGVEAAARMSGETVTPDLLRCIAIMERAALDVWFRRR